MKEYTDYVNATFKEVEQSGLVPLDDVFINNYAEMHPDLKEQLEEYKKYLEEVK